MIITIINGPNLNLLGNREKDVYGSMSFEAYLDILKSRFPLVEFRYVQSNIEGEIVDFIQDESKEADAIILNAAGYTHTSVSIADAVAAVQTPVIEVHISNILGREEFRQKSLISAHCSGSLLGFGLDGYRLAVEAIIEKIR